MTLEQLQTVLQEAKDAVDILVSTDPYTTEQRTMAVSHLRSLLPRYEDHLAIGDGVRGLLDKLDGQSVLTPEMADRNDRAWAEFFRNTRGGHL